MGQDRVDFSSQGLTSQLNTCLPKKSIFAQSHITNPNVAVPADGVKGKTWGPSSAPGGGGAAKVRQPIVDETGDRQHLMPQFTKFSGK